MKTRKTEASGLAALAALALVIAGCASSPPRELLQARAAYLRAASGNAPTLTPGDLHKARVALDQAEQVFADEEDTQRTRDLAYIAQRKAELADVRAQAALAATELARAKRDYDAKQTEIVAKAQGELGKTRAQLAESKRNELQKAGQVSEERAAREVAERTAVALQKEVIQSERVAREAQDALAKLAAKEEERGTVITLSGAVLFRSNDAALLPSAMSRLDEVAAALTLNERSVLVEGHTDSKGLVATNMSLAQRRAESVRAYLIGKGVPPDKIAAQGIGPDRPIDANDNPEGRANNRRVEIVLLK